MQAYFLKLPVKIFNLRPDSLAILLSLANVGAYGRVICVDATGGVVAAACVERMGGYGTLACVHAEQRLYSLDAVRQLNAPRMIARSARHCTLASLLTEHAAQAAATAPAASDVTAAAAAASTDVVPTDAATIANSGSDTAAVAAATTPAAADIADSTVDASAGPLADASVSTELQTANCAQESIEASSEAAAAACTADIVATNTTDVATACQAVATEAVDAADKALPHAKVGRSTLSTRSTTRTMSFPFSTA